ncbi:hypothetical protein Zmor_014169 [Zophobas morio]|uniref:Uncharacterized protein n=1 Tax=Zophobas morio TaxID=2755281 RepID=A0AA38IH93_9CUCU|nr:hypothetical protein Zmor_014169 [Zophobas morio]
MSPLTLLSAKAGKCIRASLPSYEGRTLPNGKRVARRCTVSNDAISPFRDGAHTVLANSRTGRTNVLYKLMNIDTVIALNVRLIRNIILFAFLTTSAMCSDHKREDDTITPRSR